MKYLPLLLAFMVGCVAASPIGVELHLCSKKTCEGAKLSDGSDSLMVNAIVGVREYAPCLNKCSLVGLVNGDQFLAMGSTLDIVCKFWPNTPQCCVKRYGEDE